MTVSTLEIGLEEARFKAAATVATGLRTLEFYAAAFSDTPDKNGDIIDPHAFDGWLKEFYAEGKALPISFNHAAVLDGLDPTNVVGYAPADPEHVWADDYGLRVSGYLDTVSEKGKAVEWQIENGLLRGASLAFEVPEDGMETKDDHTRISTVSKVREVGPVPNPANQGAVLLWMKSAGLLEVETEVPYMTVDEFRTIIHKAVDNTTWDGNRAMGMCSTAAEYRSICAGQHSAGSPDERQHWALPHHYLGRGPNAAGVRNALARLPQTQGLTNAGAARSHLEAHMSEVNPATASEDETPTEATDGTLTGAVQVEVEAPEDVMLSHQKAAASLQSAHDALVRAGAVCASVGEAAKSEDVEPPPPRSVEEFVEEVRRQTADAIAGDAVAVRNRKMKLLESSLP